MGIALTDDHRELAEVARGFLTSQKARAAARSLLDAPEEAPAAVLAGPRRTRLAGPAHRRGTRRLGIRAARTRGRHRRTRSCGGAGAVRADRHRVGGDRQRRYRRAEVAAAAGLIDGTVTAGIGLDGNVRVNNGVADGDAGIVLGAGLGDLLLIAAGDDVLVVDRGRSGVTVEVPENLDPTRRSGRVRLEKVSVSDDDILTGARESALARARTLLAAEAVGGAADCVDAAVEYAKVRQQFGRTIATFQAIKHHCANMLVARSRRSPRYGTPPARHPRTRTSSGWRPLRLPHWRFRPMRATRN